MPEHSLPSPASHLRFAAALFAIVLAAAALWAGLPSERALSAHPLHTELRESHPPADSVVDEVQEVLLVFTTAVQLPLSRITVIDPLGREVPAGDVEHPDPESTDRLVVRFPSPLDPGEYRVRWSTAGPDSHVISDSLSFRVAGEPEVQPDPLDPEQAPTPADRIPPPEPDRVGILGILPEGTAQRWLHLLATILLLGVVTFRYGVLAMVARSEGIEMVEERALRGLRRFGWIAAALLMVTLFTRLQHHLSQLGAGEGAAWDLAGHVLLRTAWGGGWFLHLAAAALAVVGLARMGNPGSEGRGWGIVAGAAILLPLVPALQGHAMAADAVLASVPAIYLHVAAAGSWLGGLLMLVMVGIPSVKNLPRGAGSRPPLFRVVNGFSRVGLLSVPLIVATGIATFFLYGVDLGELTQTTWGRVLLLKVALAAGAFLLGYYNWRRVRPSLAAHPDPGALRIPASLEAVIGIVVLLVAAVLVAVALP